MPLGGVAWIDIVELQVRALSISSSENSQGGNMAIAHYEISSHVSTILIVRNLGVPNMRGPKDNSTGGLLLLCFLLSGRLIFTHFLSIWLNYMYIYIYIYFTKLKVAETRPFGDDSASPNHILYAFVLIHPDCGPCNWLRLLFFCVFSWHICAEHAAAEQGLPAGSVRRYWKVKKSLGCNLPLEQKTYKVRPPYR